LNFHVFTFKLSIPVIIILRKRQILVFAIAFQISTNVAMTTADVNISVRTNLEITSVTVYRDMTSTMTAKLVPVTCTLICETMNECARTPFVFFVCDFKVNRLIYGDCI